ERAMLLLSDIPGITAQSALEQGDEPGSTDLLLEINEAKRINVQIDADNYGSPNAGRYRMGASLRVNSPLEYGDNLDLRVLRTSGGGLDFARVGYELPVGSNGVRAGIGVGRLRYELGAEFAVLDATGTADVFNLVLTHPLIRSRGRNLFGKLTFEHKSLEDKIELVSLTSNKNTRSFGVGLTYEQRDGFFGSGYSGASLTLYSGNLDIENADARALDQASDGRKTEGSFMKLGYQFSRMQNLSQRSNLFISLNGQATRKNLDSAEKISLGGAQAVRAYAASEVVADEGEILVLEYRYSFLPAFTVSGFYDAGWARVNHKPLPEDVENNRSLRGYGVGVVWIPGAGFSINASLAWRDTAQSRVTDEERDPRLYVYAVKTF
ncbi:MAG TPA: ShlB/FhaC/HecB family hemolysin secretion/activation protein, partial [Burkholderiales bacterium]|nr:ShlB/FhaC/HecB family hemolysin secretion/activation protein [Burkholderiales bacterium]